MGISRARLKRIIREQFEAIEDVEVDALEPAGALAENLLPEQEVMVEMELASKALEQVVESVTAAAAACNECAGPVLMQAPVVEAVIAQAEALQEMVEAQATVIEESVGAGGDVGALGPDEAFAVGMAAAVPEA